MSLQIIPPQNAAENLNCFHQKLSWKIKEEKWRIDETLYLRLDTKIPGSACGLGGCVIISSKREVFGFLTRWPKDLDSKNIRLEAIFSVKLSDGSLVSIICDEVQTRDDMDHNGPYKELTIGKVKVKLDAELLYDEERCFAFEAELKVTHGDTNDGVGSKEIKGFVNDIGSIFHDRKTSDVVVVAGNEKFYCHKNILSARCEVFKNMLAPHTSESENNTIEIKEVPPEAVESMLKYIYNGEVLEDPVKLTPDLLNAAEMYLLDHLKEACVKSLIENLEVSSCISTFIMAGRFNSSNLKEVVMQFIKCKAEEVMETEDCAKLLKTDPALAQELMKAIAKGSKEKHQCQFCVLSYHK